MRVLIIGLFAPEFMIAQANSLASKCKVNLMVTRQNLAALFPDDRNPVERLFANGLVDNHIDVKKVNYPTGSFLYKIGFIYQIIKIVRRFRPDILHYHSGGEPWIPLALLFLRDFPLVVSIHDAAHHPGDKPPKLILTIKNRLLSWLADCVIVHGIQQSEVFSRQHPINPEKMHMIYLAAPELFKQCSEFRAPLEPHTVLFFGRVQWYKGIDTLIKAAPYILRKVPDLKIVIAGAGDCSNIYQAEPDYPGLFEIHNEYIKAEEVAYYFSRAAVIVLPYKKATQSGIIPIAYMFHKPVVATRVGSIPEVVEDGKTGLLVNANDELALADALIELLENPELCSSMGQTAEKLYLRIFSPSILAEKTQRVYEKTLNMYEGVL